MFFVVKLIWLISMGDAVRISLDNDKRIVGGYAIDIKEAPYQVSVLIKNKHRCGGSIIAKDLILSAAHCFDTLYPGLKLSIRAGSLYTDKDGQVIKVKSYKYNKKFTTSTFDYDVALLRLEKPLELSDSVKIIQMASADEKLKEGDLCETSGWGDMMQKPPLPSPPQVRNKKKLQQVTVPIVQNDRCNKMFGGYKFNVTENMICAGYDDGGRDSCQGDSGGPFVYKNKLFGIVSTGFGCAWPKLPGVYSNVARLRKWIDENSKLL